MTDAIITLLRVNKTYKGVAGNVRALVDASLEIAKGESTVVIGRSGSGKSTLLNVVSGIDRPESGELNIAGVPVHTLTETALARWRGRTIGIVFQSYQLIPSLSVLDNVLFPMDLVGVIERGSRRDRATKLLEQVGLLNKVDKFPNELSGGEGQRVAIARALANDPPIILADEATGNLDSKTGDQIYELFGRLKGEGKTLLVVTHERSREKDFDRVVHVQDGVLSSPKVLA